MFSCPFLKSFKNTFFIELLQWLPLLILKPLDLQRQLCKWVSKLVTIYFISTFLVLVGIFVFILGEHKLFFSISTALRLRTYDVFDFFRWPHSWSFTWLFGWEPLIPIQHSTKFWRPWPWWRCIFPVSIFNGFKLLTDYAETRHLRCLKGFWLHLCWKTRQV